MGKDSRKSPVLIFVAAAVAAFLIYLLTTPSSRRPRISSPSETAAAVQGTSSEAGQDDTAGPAIGSGKVPFDKVDFSGLTLEEKANIAAARRYEARKETIRKRNAAKRKVKEAFYSSGGNEIAQAKQAMRKGQFKVAVSQLLEALRKTGDNRAAKMAAHRYLAQSYEKIGDIPKYCLNMYKYLDLAEKQTKDEDSLEQIRIMKNQLKESIDKFKAAGVGTDE